MPSGENATMTDTTDQRIVPPGASDDAMPTGENATMTDQRIISPGASDEDYQEVGLRPRRLEEYIGQEKVKDNLRILLDAASCAARRSIMFCCMAPPVWARRRSRSSSPARCT